MRRPVGERAGGGVTDRRRLGEDLLHPRVRREALALLDTDGGEQAQGLRIDGLVRLFLHDRVDFLEEGEVHRVDRVENSPETLTNVVAGGFAACASGRCAGAA